MSKLIVPKGHPSEAHKLDCLNWPAEWPYKPEVEFRIWHSGDVLHLEYKVCEQGIRMEFNAIGTMVLSWRTGRLDPEHAPADVLASVRREAGGKPSVEGSRKGFEEKASEGPWTLKADIPASALWRSGVKSFDGLRARGNFYKCGDGLAVPHFVTFAPISTPKPDYHRPEFFTELEFE